jgi:hypothetical protein
MFHSADLPSLSERESALKATSIPAVVFQTQVGKTPADADCLVLKVHRRLPAALLLHTSKRDPCKFRARQLMIGFSF